MVILVLRVNAAICHECIIAIMFLVWLFTIAVSRCVKRLIVCVWCRSTSTCVCVCYVLVLTSIVVLRSVFRTIPHHIVHLDEVFDAN